MTRPRTLKRWVNLYQREFALDGVYIDGPFVTRGIAVGRDLACKGGDPTRYNGLIGTVPITIPLPPAKRTPSAAKGKGKATK